MQRNQYFVGVRYGDRQHANLQYFRAAEAVDRRGSHRLWNGGHVASHSAARHLRGRPRQLIGVESASDFVQDARGVWMLPDPDDGRIDYGQNREGAA
jgi:hypothetical protein